VVLALPRGGVPVASEVARTLNAPLDVFVVRKLGAPGQEELAMGAIASGGLRVVNWEVVRGLGISDGQIEEASEREIQELRRRELQYRGARDPINVRGRTVILVDDGLATGSTMRAAVAALRQQAPQRVVVAVPVGALATCESLARDADKVVCLDTPVEFYAVGQWYESFPQTSDEEVSQLLDEAAKAQSQRA
jgi:predicted phosphoribosyltransferase